MLAAVALGLVTFVLFNWRLPREHSTSSPAISTPKYAKSEKAGWLDEPSKSTNPVKHEHKKIEKAEPYRNSASQFPVVPVRLRPGWKRVTGSKSYRKEKPDCPTYGKVQRLVFFSSLTGTTESRARSLLSGLQISLKDDLATVLEPQIHDLSYIDYDDFFITPPRSHETDQNVQYFYLILLPSYNIDTTLDNFLAHLQETHHDFRIDTAPLSGIAGYSVFGFGDKEGWSTEEEGFCSQAVELDRWMAKLSGRKRAYPLGLGDVKSDSEVRLEEWRDGVVKAVLDIATRGGLGEGVPGSGDAVESEEEDDADETAKS